MRPLNNSPLAETVRGAHGPSTIARNGRFHTLDGTNFRLNSARGTQFERLRSAINNQNPSGLTFESLLIGNRYPIKAPHSSDGLLERGIYSGSKTRGIKT